MARDSIQTVNFSVFLSGIYCSFFIYVLLYNCLCQLKIEIKSRKPLGTFDSWSSPNRYFSEYFVIHPLAPKIFANILRSTRLPIALRSRSDVACLMLRQSWCCIIANACACVIPCGVPHKSMTSHALHTRPWRLSIFAAA